MMDADYKDIGKAVLMSNDITYKSGFARNVTTGAGSRGAYQPNPGYWQYPRTVLYHPYDIGYVKCPDNWSHNVFLLSCSTFGIENPSGQIAQFLNGLVRSGGTPLKNKVEVHFNIQSNLWPEGNDQNTLRLLRAAHLFDKGVYPYIGATSGQPNYEKSSTADYHESLPYWYIDLAGGGVASGTASSHQHNGRISPNTPGFSGIGDWNKDHLVATRVDYGNVSYFVFSALLGSPSFKKIHQDLTGVIRFDTTHEVWGWIKKNTTLWHDLHSDVLNFMPWFETPRLPGQGLGLLTGGEEPDYTLSYDPGVGATQDLQTDQDPMMLAKTIRDMRVSHSARMDAAITLLKLKNLADADRREILYYLAKLSPSSQELIRLLQEDSNDHFLSQDWRDRLEMGSIYLRNQLYNYGNRDSVKRFLADFYQNKYGKFDLFLESLVEGKSPEEKWEIAINLKKCSVGVANLYDMSVTEFMWKISEEKLSLSYDSSYVRGLFDSTSLDATQEKFLIGNLIGRGWWQPLAEDVAAGGNLIYHSTEFFLQKIPNVTGTDAALAFRACARYVYDTSWSANNVEDDYWTGRLKEFEEAVPEDSRFSLVNEMGFAWDGFLGYVIRAKSVSLAEVLWFQRAGFTLGDKYISNLEADVLFGDPLTILKAIEALNQHMNREESLKQLAQIDRANLNSVPTIEKLIHKYEEKFSLKDVQLLYKESQSKNNTTKKNVFWHIVSPKLANIQEVLNDLAQHDWVWLKGNTGVFGNDNLTLIKKALLIATPSDRESFVQYVNESIRNDHASLEEEYASAFKSIAEMDSGTAGDVPFIRKTLSGTSIKLSDKE
ncbi:MAG: hypothetical protein LBF76_00455, partial [Holosporales bacterium]|nr:hypothetical protein [Holosporales bacterium]